MSKKTSTKFPEQTSVEFELSPCAVLGGILDELDSGDLTETETLTELMKAFPTWAAGAVSVRQAEHLILAKQAEIDAYIAARELGMARYHVEVARLTKS